MIRLLLFLSAVIVFAQPPFPPFGVGVRNAANNSSKDVAPGAFISITTTAPELQSLVGVAVMMRYQPGDPFRPLSTFPAPNGVGVWAVVPNDAPLGDFWVTLIRGDVLYTDYVIVRREAPGLFTQNYSGFGPALALNYLGGAPTRNALTAAAVPDRTVALFASGLNNARAADVTVDIAGQTVPANYAGPQGTPGLDQINFVVPKSAYLGCYVPVAVRVRGVVSNNATLSINTDTFACAHPLGLAYGDLKTLDAGGSIPLANLSLSVIQRDNNLLSERAGFLLTPADAATTALYSGVQVPDSAILTCGPSSVVGAVGIVQGLVGDAGPITLLGPRGQELDMFSPYFTTAPSLPSRFFTPGEWRLRAPGGPVFFPFERIFTLPPVIDSTNIQPLSVLSSEQDLEILWNPTVFGPGDLVIVSIPGATCTVRATDGRVTMPKPPRSFSETIQVIVVPHPASRAQFSLAMRDGRTMRGFVSYSFWLGVTVAVQ